MNTIEDVRAVQDRKTGPELAQQIRVASTGPISKPSKTVVRLGKSHPEYWKGRLEKRTYSRGGETFQVPEWYIRLHYRGRREWFNTQASNKEVAAVKARDIYATLREAGWQKALQEFKPDMERPKDGCTVGEFLDQVRAVSGLNPVTLAGYSRKFRTLVSGVFGTQGDASKHDYVKGGYAAWLAKVHAVKLHDLTPERINTWKVKHLQAAGKNPLTLKHARVTVRSVLLCSKALFAPSIRKHLTIRPPTPLPFEGVVLPELGKSRYKSEINLALLLQQAKCELAEGYQGERLPPLPRPELFKIVLLALGAGMRRDEIDKLQWKQVLWDRNAIRVETTEFGRTKSAESENDIDVDPGLLDILKGYLPKPGEGTPFVIASTVSPRPEATSYHHYRCGRLFAECVQWLRSKGIRARNALHALRKEFGSQICAQAGIYAASAALRHSSINLTREHYIDKKTTVVLKVGGLLNGAVAEGAEKATA